MDSYEKSSLKDELVRVIADVDNLEKTSEPMVASKVQDIVKKSIATLENLTRTVSNLAIFSENEDINEIETDSLRFLLLPALLGYCTGKVAGQSRLDILQREAIYYKDYLKRLRLYNIIGEENVVEEKIDGDDRPAVPASMRTVLAQSTRRQKKLERYKERRNLEEKLETLRQRANTGIGVDDDLARELYLTELKVWAGKVEDAIETVQQEMELLRARGGDAGQPTTSAGRDSNQMRAPPLKPFIITRNELQKAVYGMGYPSLPAMSLEEFFEQKRREGQIQVVDGSDQPKGPLTEEDERIERENGEEKDDPDLIRHQREYDEYRDDHRRGWGSVHNKG